MAKLSLDLPIKKGLQAAYTGIETKDANTLYITTDTKHIYLGEILLAENLDVGNSIVSVAFDDATQTFTFTHLDSTTTTVDLVLESVIKDVEYNTTTHKLKFTLVSGTSTEIDLTDLIDAYEGEASDTATVTIADGKVKADVKISDAAGNALVKDEKGLFVATSSSIAVEDTDTVDLDFTSNKIKANVKVAETAGNAITVDAGGGLYVKDMVVEDTTTVDLTYSDTKLTGAVKVSASTGNMIAASADGLLAEVPTAVIGTF